MRDFLKRISRWWMRQTRINAIHEDLNSVVLDMQVLARSDDTEFKNCVLERGMTRIRNAKARMLDLGLEYQR